MAWEWGRLAGENNRLLWITQFTWHECGFCISGTSWRECVVLLFVCLLMCVCWMAQSRGKVQVGNILHRWEIECTHVGAHHTYAHFRTHSDPFIGVWGVWKLPCHSQTQRMRHTPYMLKHCRSTVSMLKPSVTFYILKEIGDFNKSVWFCLFDM